MLRRLLPAGGGLLRPLRAPCRAHGRGRARRCGGWSSGGQNIRRSPARIKEIEHETDVITHSCVERLHKTFITPLRPRRHPPADHPHGRRHGLHRVGRDRGDALRAHRDDRSRRRPLADVLVRATETVAIAVGGLRNMKQSRRRSSRPASRSTASRTRATRSSAAPSPSSSAERPDPLLVLEVEGGLRGAGERDRPLRGRRQRHRGRRARARLSDDASRRHRRRGGAGLRLRQRLPRRGELDRDGRSRRACSRRATPCCGRRSSTSSPSWSSRRTSPTPSAAASSTRP